MSKIIQFPHEKAKPVIDDLKAYFPMIAAGLVNGVMYGHAMEQHSRSIENKHIWFDPWMHAHMIRAGCLDDLRKGREPLKADIKAEDTYQIGKLPMAGISIEIKTELRRYFIKVLKLMKDNGGNGKDFKIRIPPAGQSKVRQQFYKQDFEQLLLMPDEPKDPMNLLVFWDEPEDWKVLGKLYVVCPIEGGTSKNHTKTQWAQHVAFNGLEKHFPKDYNLHVVPADIQEAFKN